MRFSPFASSSAQPSRSIPVGDHELRDYYVAQGVPRPATTSNTTPDLTPYLGLRARLSQIWINRWTILLFLVLARTLIAISSLDDGINTARREAVSVCSDVEKVGSAMASMPHFLSKGVNELAASGVEKAVHALMTMLDLAVTGIEELVIFIINLLTSTYVCLITMSVNSSLHTVLGAADEIANFLNKTVSAVSDDIKKTATNFEDTVNKLLKGANSLSSLLGGGSPLPTLDINGDIDQLHTLQLPHGIHDELLKLNSSIPTFDEVNNFTSSTLRLPFEQVKKLLHQRKDNFQFDRSVFPVPQKKQLTFCSDNGDIDKFFNSLLDLGALARRIFVALLTILAILACIPMTYREIRRWKTMQGRAKLVTNGRTADPMDVVYVVSRPYTSTVGIKLAGRFRSLRKQTAVRWAVAYATSIPALFVISLALAGFFSCLCQYILLKLVEKEVPKLTGEVAAFTGKVVDSLNNDSQKWAVDINGVIGSMNDELNNDIFGWANQSAAGLNDTLNTFVNLMNDGLNLAFNNTILKEPVTEVVNCLITLKIKGIQNGLTWITDHAHIDFPRLPNDTFSLGALESVTDASKTESFLSSPSSVAADDISGAVERVTSRIERTIRQEAIISTFVLLVWLVIVLIGLCRSTFFFLGRSKTRAEGGRHPYNSDPVTENLRGFDVPAPPYDTVNESVSRVPTTASMPPPRPVQQPFPVASTAPSIRSGLDAEKINPVEARHVGLAVTDPKMVRSSSYGNVDTSSAYQAYHNTNTEKNYNYNPFIG